MFLKGLFKFNRDGGIEFFESDKRHMSKYSLDLEKVSLLYLN